LELGLVDGYGPVFIAEGADGGGVCGAGGWAFEMGEGTEELGGRAADEAGLRGFVEGGEGFHGVDAEMLKS
jgi:hypothetical protein